MERLRWGFAADLQVRLDPIYFLNVYYSTMRSQELCRHSHGDGRRSSPFVPLWTWTQIFRPRHLLRCYLPGRAGVSGFGTMCCKAMHLGAPPGEATHTGDVFHELAVVCGYFRRLWRLFLLYMDSILSISRLIVNWTVCFYSPGCVVPLNMV